MQRAKLIQSAKSKDFNLEDNKERMAMVKDKYLP